MAAVKAQFEESKRHLQNKDADAAWDVLISLRKTKHWKVDKVRNAAFAQLWNFFSKVAKVQKSREGQVAPLTIYIGLLAIALKAESDASEAFSYFANHIYSVIESNSMEPREVCTLYTQFLMRLDISECISVCMLDSRSQQDFLLWIAQYLFVSYLSQSDDISYQGKCEVTTGPINVNGLFSFAIPGSTPLYTVTHEVLSHLAEKRDSSYDGEDTRLILSEAYGHYGVVLMTMRLFSKKMRIKKHADAGANWEALGERLVKHLECGNLAMASLNVEEIPKDSTSRKTCSSAFNLMGKVAEVLECIREEYMTSWWCKGVRREREGTISPLFVSNRVYSPLLVALGGNMSSDRSQSRALSTMGLNGIISFISPYFTANREGNKQRVMDTTAAIVRLVYVHNCVKLKRSIADVHADQVGQDKPISVKEVIFEYVNIAIRHCRLLTGDTEFDVVERSAVTALMNVASALYNAPGREGETSVMLEGVCKVTRSWLKRAIRVLEERKVDAEKQKEEAIVGEGLCTLHRQYKNIGELLKRVMEKEETDSEKLTSVKDNLRKMSIQAIRWCSYAVIRGHEEERRLIDLISNFAKQWEKEMKPGHLAKLLMVNIFRIQEKEDIIRAKDAWCMAGTVMRCARHLPILHNALADDAVTIYKLALAKERGGERNQIQERIHWTYLEKVRALRNLAASLQSSKPLVMAKELLQEKFGIKEDEVEEEMDWESVDDDKKKAREHCSMSVCAAACMWMGVLVTSALHQAKEKTFLKVNPSQRGGEKNTASHAKPASLTLFDMPERTRKGERWGERGMGIWKKHCEELGERDTQFLLDMLLYYQAEKFSLQKDLCEYLCQVSFTSSHRERRATRQYALSYLAALYSSYGIHVHIDKLREMLSCSQDEIFYDHSSLVALLSRKKCSDGDGATEDLTEHSNTLPLSSSTWIQKSGIDARACLLLCQYYLNQHEIVSAEELLSACDSIWKCSKCKDDMTSEMWRLLTGLLSLSRGSLPDALNQTNQTILNLKQYWQGWLSLNGAGRDGDNQALKMKNYQRGATMEYTTLLFQTLWQLSAIYHGLGQSRNSSYFLDRAMYLSTLLGYHSHYLFSFVKYTRLQVCKYEVSNDFLHHMESIRDEILDTEDEDLSSVAAPFCAVSLGLANVYCYLAEKREHLDHAEDNGSKAKKGSKPVGGLNMWEKANSHFGECASVARDFFIKFSLSAEDYRGECDDEESDSLGGHNGMKLIERCDCLPLFARSHSIFEMDCLAQQGIVSLAIKGAIKVEDDVIPHNVLQYMTSRYEPAIQAHGICSWLTECRLRQKRDEEAASASAAKKTTSNEEEEQTLENEEEEEEEPEVEKAALRSSRSRRTLTKKSSTANASTTRRRGGTRAAVRKASKAKCKASTQSSTAASVIDVISAMAELSLSSSTTLLSSSSSLSSLSCSSSSSLSASLTTSEGPTKTDSLLEYCWDVVLRHGFLSITESVGKLLASQRNLDPLSASAYLSESVGVVPKHHLRLSHSRKYPSLPTSDTSSLTETGSTVDSVIQKIGSLSIQERSGLLSSSLSPSSSSPHLLSKILFAQEREALDGVMKDFAVNLPWTICCITVDPDDSHLLLSRFNVGSKSNKPTFVRSSTSAQRSHRLIKSEVETFAGLLQRNEDTKTSAAQAAQKNTKAACQEWWAIRRKLDEDMGSFAAKMEGEWLGVWKGMVLGDLEDEHLRERMEQGFTDIIERVRIPGIEIDEGAVEKIRVLFYSTPYLSEEEESDVITTVASLLPLPTRSCGEESRDGGGESPPLSTSSRQTIARGVRRTKTRGSTISTSTKSKSTTEAVKIQDATTLWRELQNLYNAEMDNYLKTGGEGTPHPEQRQPVILVLDKLIQHLPWETMPILRKHCQPISRVPSLHYAFIHALALQHDQLLVQPMYDTKKDEKKEKSEKDARDQQALRAAEHRQHILREGVDADKLYFIINPDGEHEQKGFRSTQIQFWKRVLKEEGRSGWNGIANKCPKLENFQMAMESHDIFLYVGHNGGEQYVRPSAVEKFNASGVALLMGCSSGKLRVEGEFGPLGISLSYLLAGCPAVVGNLWDITDGDSDILSLEVVGNWVGRTRDEGKEANWRKGRRTLAHLVAEARVAKPLKLKSLVGGAAVCFGVPVKAK